MDMQQFCFGLAKRSYLLLMACKDVIFIVYQMKIDTYRQKSILQVILLNYHCSNPKEYLIL